MYSTHVTGGNSCTNVRISGVNVSGGNSGINGTGGKSRRKCYRR